MVTTVNDNSNPQPTFGVQVDSVPRYTPTGNTGRVLKPRQVMGLVPLVCITEDERCGIFTKCDCREWINDDYYINPVFASTSDTDLLKNDHNFFWVDFPFYFQYQWSDNSLATFGLDKWDGTSWNGAASIEDNTYGTYYDFNSICIPNWKGFDIDWRKVLIALGEGIYRFSVSYTIFGNSGILVSEPFCLKEWSCAATDVTVRWETTITGGRIGSITDDCKVFELCCKRRNIAAPDEDPYYVDGGSVTLNDQIRVYAFFGREKTEYERVNIEYQTGDVIQIRNEAIQKFEYESALQPKWVHDRLKAYGIMADYLYVTDYNWNNADYEIDKKLVVCDGAYEPEYHEDTRLSFVKVQFKEGCQNVIRDKCCDTASRKSIQ